jgi:hypothetical protein
MTSGVDFDLNLSHRNGRLQKLDGCVCYDWKHSGAARQCEFNIDSCDWLMVGKFSTASLSFPYPCVNISRPPPG